MKYVAEYRSVPLVEDLLEQIRQTVHRPWKIMEVCGGQTHSIMKFGIQDLLHKAVGDKIELLHGPGCPVCVTPIEKVESALQLAGQANVIFCTYGDMMRVPGEAKDLMRLKAEGAQVEIVYSPMEALQKAQEHPGREVVFWSVGFETTAPAAAFTIKRAVELKVKNFSVLLSHVLVPPALELILQDPQNQVNGFLAAGHVCTVMGLTQYQSIAEKYQVPIIITGFEPVDLLRGILRCVQSLQTREFSVRNEYPRAVQAQGNLVAQALLREVFVIDRQNWRGIGNINLSALQLAEAYQACNAEKKFSSLLAQPAQEFAKEKICLSGDIMKGKKKPTDCEHFNKSCHPENPIGAPMVSSEGVCRAYFQYQKAGIRPGELSC